jgi:cytochrome c oxidase subunit 4
MAEGHASPNYWMIWLYLFILTVAEIAVIFTPMARLLIVIALIALALSKASLVAMYFMHLRFERRTLAMVAVTPIFLGTLLVFILLPDHSAVPHKTTGVAKPAAVEKH